MSPQSNAGDGKKHLLDLKDVEGLNMGLNSRGISIFWHTLDYFHTTGKRHWLMKTYIVFLHLVGFTYCLLGFAAVFVIEMDIKRVTAAIMNPICGLQTVFKCWSFSYSTAEYLKLFELLKRNFMTCVPPEKKLAANEVTTQNISVTNQFVKYAMRWNCVTLCMVSFMPYLRSQIFREFFHLGVGPIVPNKICENEYPFEWNSSPVYEIIWFYEQVAVTIAIATSSAYQAILLFLVMALVGHLKVLGFVMETMKASDFTGDSFQRMDESAKAKSYKQLIKCIKDHQKINHAGDLLAERYNTFLTFHLGTAIIVGIIAIFNCTFATELADKIKFAIMCVYGLLEVAIYCLCGQLLENASEGVLRQVYSCEWEEMDPKFRRAAQLMMVRANKPICLRAGRLYRVNLETLGAIQQLVYSSLTMLSSMVQ
uniref:Odorant receptor n=1 Tax=Adelphocoris suturalis TaxID=323751 RepID=A0A7T7FRK8_9HEMI|nr:olfactory receptor 10 [Adelphocoris suturalis]